MKRIEIVYNPLFSHTEVRTSMGNTEAIGILQMAIRHLEDKEIMVGRRNKETPGDFGAMENEWGKVLISDALGDVIARKLMRHPLRPQTMGQVVNIPSDEILRISGVGLSTITAVRNYFSQYAIFWK